MSKFGIRDSTDANDSSWEETWSLRSTDILWFGTTIWCAERRLASLDNECEEVYSSGWISVHCEEYIPVRSFRIAETSTLISFRQSLISLEWSVLKCLSLLHWLWRVWQDKQQWWHGLKFAAWQGERFEPCDAHFKFSLFLWPVLGKYLLYDSSLSFSSNALMRARSTAIRLFLSSNSESNEQILAWAVYNSFLRRSSLNSLLGTVFYSS